MTNEINDYKTSAYDSNLLRFTISGILGDSPINSKLTTDFEEGQEL